MTSAEIGHALALMAGDVQRRWLSDRAAAVAQERARWQAQHDAAVVLAEAVICAQEALVSGPPQSDLSLHIRAGHPRTGPRLTCIPTADVAAYRAAREATR